MHCLCIPMQIACENTVAFDSRKALAVLGRPERHLNGPISLRGVPTLMCAIISTDVRECMRAYNRDETLRPLASRDLRCDREIIIDGRTFGRDSPLINNSA